MYIEEFISDKNDIIATAMQHPALARKRNPTIEQALKAVVGEIEKRAFVGVADVLRPQLQDMYDTYELMNGEYSDLTDEKSQDEYSSGLDEAFEALLEPYVSYLSQDWLGTKTIDSRLWETGAVDKMATSVGKEVFKQLTYGKTPAQVLSNAAITTADVEVYLSQHLAATPDTKSGAKNMSSIDIVAAKVLERAGNEFDMVDMYSELELACDDDEILSNAAAARLGLDEDDVAALEMAALEVDDVPQTVIDLMQAATTPKAQTATKKAEREAKKAERAANVVEPTVLALLKEHGGTSDGAMAQAMGVSRATYNNWVNGKTAFSPDDEQSATLRKIIVADVNGLLIALAALDGVDPMEVS